MFNLILNNKVIKNIGSLIGVIILIALIVFGAHIVLNLGRFFGTIARYAAEGNICF